MTFGLLSETDNDTDKLYNYITVAIRKQTAFTNMVLPCIAPKASEIMGFILHHQALYILYCQPVSKIMENEINHYWTELFSTNHLPTINDPASNQPVTNHLSSYQAFTGLGTSNQLFTKPVPTAYQLFTKHQYSIFKTNPSVPVTNPSIYQVSVTLSYNLSYITSNHY